MDRAWRHVKEDLHEGQWDVVQANMGLVGWCVNRMGIDDPDEREEAVQDALLGLLRAVQRFQPERGFRFSTYATFWIRQAIARGRSERMGSNYRRARRSGTEFQRPVYLETLTSRDPDDDVDWEQYLADPMPGAEDVVVGRDLVRRARARCDDEFDHQLLEALLREESITEVSARHGFSRQSGANRRARLRRRLAEDLDGPDVPVVESGRREGG